MAATATLEVTEFAPGEQDLIIRQGTHGNRQAVQSVWGLMGAGSTDWTGAGKLINARAESLLATPVFRRLVPRQRCIIPATAFQEFTGRGTDRQVLATLLFYPERDAQSAVHHELKRIGGKA